MNSLAYNFFNDKKKFIDYFFKEDPLLPMEELLINISQTPENYNVFLLLNGLKKESLSLSYINDFLVIDIDFFSPEASLKDRRTIYLKNISIDKIQAIDYPNLVYLKIPKLI